MSLDETSLAIGRLQAAQESTANDVGEVKSQLSEVNSKLDRLLARDSRKKLSFKHWIILLLSSSAGGGGVAHALHRILEK